MTLDFAAQEQIGAVIDASQVALNQVAAMLGDRDLAFHVMPASMFLAFAAVSQQLGQTPADQLRFVNAGNEAVAKVLTQRRIDPAALYGKGRRCAEITREMARTACETAKRDLDGTNLVVHRQEARDKLMFKALLEFCAVAKLLQPIGLPAAMSMSNEAVAEVIRSGHLDRNVIKLGG